MSIKINFDTKPYQEKHLDFLSWFYKICNELSIDVLYEENILTLKGEQERLMKFFRLLNEKENKTFDDILKEIT